MFVEELYVYTTNLEDLNTVWCLNLITMMSAIRVVAMPTMAVLAVAIEIGAVMPALITVREGVPKGGWYTKCEYKGASFIFYQMYRFCSIKIDGICSR